MIAIKYCDKITINPSSHTLTINDANNEEGVVISPTRITAYWGELHNASTAYISDMIDLTGIKNFGKISAISGTTSKGTWVPSTTSDTFTFSAGANIDFVSGANLLGIKATNTDTKVTQNRSTANSGYPIILKYNTGSGNSTNTVNFNESFTYNPSSKILNVTYVKATTFSGNLSGSAASAVSAGNATALAGTNGTNVVNSAASAWLKSNSGKVTQIHEGSDLDYPLLFKYNNDALPITETVKFNSTLRFKPSANILYNTGDSANFINGYNNYLTGISAQYTILNGYNNTASMLEYSQGNWTRPTSGVMIVGSNNAAYGLKGGIIVGDHITITANNQTYPVHNAIFVGNYNAQSNLHDYANVKIVASELKNSQTAYGSDVFAVKGGGSIWSNVLFRQDTDHSFDLNGHNDVKSNYAMVTNPTPAKSAHYVRYYDSDGSYLLASKKGFIRPTDIKVTAGYDSILGHTDNAGLILTKLTAGSGMTGEITVGYSANGNLTVGDNANGTAIIGNYAPGYLTVAKGAGSINPDAHVTFGDSGPVTAFYGVNCGSTKIQYGGCNDFTDYVASNGSLQGIAYIDSKLLRTDVNYSIGSTKNNYTKSAGVFYGHFGNSYANIHIANETYYPFGGLVDDGNLPTSQIYITTSGLATLDLATGMYSTHGTPRIAAKINIGNFQNSEAFNETYLKLGGKISAVAGTFLDAQGNEISIVPSATMINISDAGGISVSLYHDKISLYDFGDEYTATWVKIITGANTLPGYFTGASAKSACSAGVANAINVTGDWTSDSWRYVYFGNGTTGNATVGRDPNFRFNPSTNILSATQITASTISATLCGWSWSAYTAGSAQESRKVYWSKADDGTDEDRVIPLTYAGHTAQQSQGQTYHEPVCYDTAFTFNSKKNLLKVPFMSGFCLNGAAAWWTETAANIMTNEYLPTINYLINNEDVNCKFTIDCTKLLKSYQKNVAYWNAAPNHTIYVCTTTSSQREIYFKGLPYPTTALVTKYKPATTTATTVVTAAIAANGNYSIVMNRNAQAYDSNTGCYVSNGKMLSFILVPNAASTCTGLRLIAFAH